LEDWILRKREVVWIQRTMIRNEKKMKKKVYESCLVI